MAKRIKMIVPVPFSEEACQVMARQLPPTLLRDDIEVEFAGAGRMQGLAKSLHDMAVLELAVIEAGIRAEEEGFDAVCINTVSDSGLAALRSRLSIPVVAPGQAAFHLACTLGQRFSVLTMWPQWLFPLDRKSLCEGSLEARLASIRAVDVRRHAEALLQGREETVFDRLLEVGRRAIEEDGADVLVLGATTMHRAHAYLAEQLPVPVLNPGHVAFKLCETLLDLGLNHSRRANPASVVGEFQAFAQAGERV
ncbi:aspartate/glutamate racemase family protein [Pseudomonas sp. ZM23]|uniref:Aspartate/glutamate racemase family protein n=1 Tax=Pseudomonas triclosanedens TaxID=2961893 RepID=A0ABY6ZQ32_9PSED|nr:aspartate/glutamate racemase family protein [Pseudomonas triclosanedens]MCP8467514.1 aspartate/glutamate racemase family protein [Pseudomonas triclosanedens]MCP8471691.1 aspartate/glutamate racemase family protein [Pseudomonas triclosanedens]MCP8478956.1 aspartate/glutamate racemase family protein [Pseudomonas triclosanedens]WAI47022.1 aspartate/glutamate racemase family protein [Pseudomonas triclosanedens]